jgi:hypothetical protein
MDFEGLIAYGAPIDFDERFGVEARFGAEWLVLYPDGEYALATVAPIASLGVRAAESFGWLNLWIGADVRFRLRTLSLPAGELVTAADVSTSLTIGASYAVWTRK